MRRGIPRGLIPLAVVVIYVIVALAAPLVAPHDPNQTNLATRLLPPFSSAGGGRYLLGTDDLGRDVLSRVIYGARVSLAVAAVAVILSGTGGVALGLIAGWRRVTI